MGAQVSLRCPAASVEEGKEKRPGTDPARLILVSEGLGNSELIAFFFLKSKKGCLFVENEKEEQDRRSEGVWEELEEV